MPHSVLPPFGHGALCTSRTGCHRSSLWLDDFLDHVGDQTITKVSLDLVALTVLAPDVLQALADSATLLGVSPGIRAAEETQQTDGCNHRNSGIHLSPLVGCNYRRRMIHEQLHNDIV